MRFHYSLIRYVPDPARGEFVNVGAVAGSEESSEWEIRWVENAVRARQLDESGSLPLVWDLIDRIGREVDAFQQAVEQPTLEAPEHELSEGWLRALHERHRNIVQFSSPLPLLADSAAEALDRIFGQLIVDPARRRGSENKHPALAAMRKAYREVGLKKNEQVLERVLLHAGDHQERVDFAVANGRVVQLAQTWSFQVVDQHVLAEHVKAWGWTMQTVQQNGGVIEPDSGRTIDVPKDVDLAAVYVPPAADSPAPAVADARAVFQRLHARELDLAHAREAADVARDLLGDQLRPERA